MMKKGESERTIPEVVKEMIESGEDIEKVHQNLEILGLEWGTPEKLVKVSEEKVIPRIEEAINRMVELKERKLAEAERRRGPRRRISQARRTISKIEGVARAMDDVLEQDTVKKSIVKNILRDYAETMDRQREIKKELMRVLLEALDERRARREAAKIRRALVEIEML